MFSVLAIHMEVNFYKRYKAHHLQRAEELDKQIVKIVVMGQIQVSFSICLLRRLNLTLKSKWPDFNFLKSVIRWLLKSILKRY